MLIIKIVLGLWMYVWLFCSKGHCVMKVLKLNARQVTFGLPDVYILWIQQDLDVWLIFSVETCIKW